jgi:hypothetical protein
VKAVYHLVRHDRHGGRDVVDVRDNGRVGTLIDTARQHGGWVLKPIFNRKTGAWAVTDSDGNLFLAEEQIN